MNPKNNPRNLRLAITLGDPAGVGPEIVLRLFGQGGFPEGVQPFVVGEARHLEQAAKAIGPEMAIRGLIEQIPIIEPPDFRFSGPLVSGKVSTQCGAAAWAYIRHAVALVQSGQADAVVTAPIHKEALKAAGCPYPGHTEMLAGLAGDDVQVAMLLVGGGLRVALATIHEPISRVPALLSIEGILEHLRILNGFIPWFGLQTEPEEMGAKHHPIDSRDNTDSSFVTKGPRIGVTGLNPHAGEGGIFGNEERDIIAPAIARAREEGIDAIGPIPGDTAFFFHREGAYDAVLAMYHDQALIPVKTLDFHGGVNVTMGLPFIRTSVDHGTGFDIAGKGIARADSLRAALNTAAVLVRNRNKATKGA